LKLVLSPILELKGISHLIECQFIFVMNIFNVVMFYDQVGYVATEFFSFIKDFNVEISKCWSSNVEGVFNNAQLQCAFLKILHCKKLKGQNKVWHLVKFDDFIVAKIISPNLQLCWSFGKF
jgi:hypothetical protein